ncbi:hypothetical protein G3I13_16135 [Streptomyces sp. SID6673]|nr:hypothetical protein [Streptomyces sp. SID11726]NEB25866.1 hypothetical protein [Streptomyces sp. SID6673]
MKAFNRCVAGLRLVVAESHTEATAHKNSHDREVAENSLARSAAALGLRRAS